MRFVWSAVIAARPIGLAYQITDGFAAFTTESARRLDVSRNPRPIPPTVLVDSTGGELVIGAPGQPEMLVEFIYTSCPTLCVALGDAFHRAQAKIAADPALTGVRLISISFDIDRDTPARLETYGRAHGAEAPTWRIAKPLSNDDLKLLLNTFGIVVLDDGNGGFVHNAAIHHVDQTGRLTRIVDLKDIDKLLSDMGRRP